MAQTDVHPAPLDAQIASLDSLLAALSRTRASIPALLRTFAELPSSPAVDRPTLYRSAAQECSSSIRSLAEALDNLEPVLQAAEASERDDPAGVVVRKRERTGRQTWEHVAEILGGRVVAGKVGGTQKGAYENQLLPPTSREELVDFVRRWESARPRVKVRVLPNHDEDVAELQLVLKGVMRATLVLHWADRDDGEPGRTPQVELIACFGLKEEKPPYLPSQFTLFQSISNSAMDIIDRALRRQDHATSNLEETLAFLSDPPLPF
ncbi:hypothetical protein JCM21900_003693 [Sporobolomyces salmonicolor]